MNNGQPPPDLSQLTGDLYRQWETFMTSWWDQVLESPAFISSMGDQLAGQARGRAAYQKAVTESMERLHLPTRDDVTRLARIAALLEEKLLTQEDRLLEIQDRLDAGAEAERLDRLEREVVQARIESAETRLEIRDALTALNARLDAIESRLPARRSRSRRKPAEETE